MCPGEVLCNRQQQDLDANHDEIKENATIFYMMKYPSLSFQFKFIEMSPRQHLTDSSEARDTFPAHTLGLIAFENMPNGEAAFHGFVAESDLMFEQDECSDGSVYNYNDASFPAAWHSLRANLRKRIGEYEFEMRRGDDVMTPSPDDLRAGSIRMIGAPPSPDDEIYALGMLREAIKDTALVWLSEEGTLEAPAALVVTTPPSAFVDGLATAFVGEVHKHHEGRSYCVAEGDAKDTRVAALEDLLNVVEQRRIDAIAAPSGKK